MTEQPQALPVAPPSPALPDDLDYRKIASNAWQKQLDGMQSRGELSFTTWTGSSRPSRGWDFDSFHQYVRMNTPSTPKFEGANLPMAWMPQATNIIRGAEGFEPTAYHGFGSAERKAGKFRVKDGDNVDGHEVSVGYGFNLTQKGGRQMYEAALQGQDAPSYDDVLRGRKTISEAQAGRLQEYMILQKNQILDSLIRKNGNVALRDHQRAAMISMLYQGYSPAPILAAMAKGASEAEAADLIRSTGNASFKTRRALEAALFMGSQAQSYFDNSTNQLAGRQG